MDPGTAFQELAVELVGIGHVHEHVPAGVLVAFHVRKRGNVGPDLLEREAGTVA
ncbi:hypothetical protein D3C83_169280 [compost metagenome]